MRNPHKLPPRANFWLSRGYFYTFLPPELSKFALGKHRFPTNSLPVLKNRFETDWEEEKLTKNRTYLKLSAEAACIGAFFVASKWLEQFAEKVSLNPLYFIGGALLVLAIVLGVVVLNCLRIARANPVESLKNE